MLFLREISPGFRRGLLLAAVTLFCCGPAGAAPARKAAPAAKPAPQASAEKPDRKTPPAFDMKAYMDTHKQLVQSLAAAKAVLEQDKKTTPSRAGVANYFLGELEQAALRAENCFDLAFLYFDHFLQADAVSNILAGYVGNRLRHLGHGLEDLLAELGPNLQKSPYAGDPTLKDALARLASYQALVADLSQRVIPVK